MQSAELSKAFGRNVAKPDTRLLVDPKGEPATAGEEFRTPPRNFLQ